ncbi:hypothetical protein [Niallia taxi]|uniref:hypothetical protein n=1 Tax=Niallia taxi TaxID=2499688 RepID=UPI0013E2F9B1|nr:hypothetical protein [Niallia taxi]
MNRRNQKVLLQFFFSTETALINQKLKAANFIYPEQLLELVYTIQFPFILSVK